MKILGKGLNGVVVDIGGSRAKKYYLTQDRWVAEERNLKWIQSISFLDIGCAIPKIYKSSSNETFLFEEKMYSFSHEIDFIKGSDAYKVINGPTAQVLGESLASVLFSLQTQLATHTELWEGKHGVEDSLLKHILGDKAQKVLLECKDSRVLAITKETANYLQVQLKQSKNRAILMHQDLNLHNILASKDGAVQGLIDWPQFGLTDPNLFMYQIAKNTAVWPFFKEGYEKIGGSIDTPVVYAASTIHVAWAPIICAELGVKPDDDETGDKLESIYRLFLENK